MAVWSLDLADRKYGIAGLASTVPELEPGSKGQKDNPAGQPAYRMKKCSQYRAYSPLVFMEAQLKIPPKTLNHSRCLD